MSRGTGNVAGRHLGLWKCFKRALCLGAGRNRLPALPLTKQRWQSLVPGSSPCTAHGLLVVGGAATTSPPLRREDYRVTCAVIVCDLCWTYCTCTALYCTVLCCNERHYHILLQIHLASAIAHTRACPRTASLPVLLSCSLTPVPPLLSSVP